MPAHLDLPISRHSRLSDVVDELVELQRIEYRLHARRTELLARSEELTTAALDPAASEATKALEHRATHAELGAALRHADTTMARRVSQSVSIERYYPQTVRRMRQGQLSFQHAAIISDEGMIISDPQRRSQYEEVVIEFALRETVGRLRPVAKKLAAEHTEHDHDEQHEEARTRRHVRLHDHADGMAEITAYMPAVGAYAIYDRLTRMAWKIKGLEPGIDSRSLDEIRADVMTDLLAAGTPSEELAEAGIDAITARVQVMVPVRVLDADADADADATADTVSDTHTHAGAVSAGHRADKDNDINNDTDTGSGSGTEPNIGRVAFLIGYGPIDSATARDLAARAPTWDTAYFNPLDGTILSTDRYRPNQAQRRRLRIRDMHCRFPGCRAPVQRCDLDHTVAACDGGPTSTRNIAALCRPHHRVKHHTDWEVTQLPGGIMKWNSPTGRTHYDTPVSRVMFRETDTRVTRTKSRPKNPNRASEVLRKYRKSTSPGTQADGPHPF